MNDDSGESTSSSSELETTLLSELPYRLRSVGSSKGCGSDTSCEIERPASRGLETRFDNICEEA